MGTLDLKKLLLGTSLFISASAFGVTSMAYAQDTSSDDVEVIEETEEEEVETSGDTVVVTGSRIKRDTFSSISPLQVITAEASLDAGLIDPAAILQQSEAAAGQQIDSSFQGFVLDNGPGSETLNLRGLGAGRTLLLINGRRMAPAGVEGAPTQPSINLLPGSLIERYDLLLDGASSVYGSDAVAGVGNVVLKKDFEGLEVFASGDYNVAGAGNDYTLNASWGRNNDRGFFGVGVEYDYTDEVTFGDRDFLAGCETHYEITESGEIRTVDLLTNQQTLDDTQGLIGSPQSPCVSGAGGFANRIFDRTSLAFGSAYYTPGEGNLLADFSDTGLFGVPIDQNQDGIADIYFPDFSPGSRDLEQSLLSEQKKTSIMSYGEYTLEGDMNLTPYYEVLYTNLDISANSGQGTLFPDVPGTNPFNVCNPSAPGGVDCGLAEDALLLSPEYIAAFQAYYNGGGGNANCFGLPLSLCNPATFGLLNGPLGPQRVSAQVNVRGDRNLTDVNLQQVRFAGGVKGDLPFMNNIGSFSDWSFDASFTYSTADGESTRPGVREDRLALALGFDPTTDQDGDGVVDGDLINVGGDLLELPGGPCDVANLSNPDLLQPDVAAGCIPVNMFAPSLYGGVGGEFATQAERDYLFDNRDFDTTYNQTIVNAFATGKIMDLPAGALSGVVGFEYRIDEIDSNPDNVARDGLFFGFFSDAGASGEKWTREAFFELDAPLLANHPLATELTANVSARWTEDEFYGDDWTYSAKVGWRPIDPLLLKASYGTSFRAPNLRENFIEGQSGFNGVFDPCAVPADAISITPGGGFVYDPNLDPRVTGSPEVLDACIREGRDPTTVGFDPVAGTTITNPGVEIETGGTQDIGPETSESFTAGFAFEQPWFENFDLTLGVNYYDIVIEDSIIEPSNQFIVNDCFTRQDGTRSAFCDRLTYGGVRDNISFINASFLNQDEDTVSGLDYSIRFNKELTLWDNPVDLGINLRASQLKERSNLFIGEDLTENRNNFEGEFGFPEWTGRAQFSLNWDDYTFTWTTRYIGDVAQDPAGVDEFSDYNDSQGTGFFGDTCLGPAFGDELCRDVGFADEWTEHAASIRYTGDTWQVRAGVSNIFDNEPPLVDGNEVFSISNTPIGNGYDLNGRQFFMTLSKDFN
jgi:iron complex outermembrane receptor protein